MTINSKSISLFFYSMLVIQSLHPMHLITKKGMSPEQAVEKCIKDCNHRGLKQLLENTLVADYKNGKEIGKTQGEVFEVFGNKFGKVIVSWSATFALALLLPITDNKYVKFCYGISCINSAFQANKLNEAAKNNDLLAAIVSDRQLSQNEKIE